MLVGRDYPPARAIGSDRTLLPKATERGTATDRYRIWALRMISNLGELRHEQENHVWGDSSHSDQKVVIRSYAPKARAFTQKKDGCHQVLSAVGLSLIHI